MHTPSGSLLLLLFLEILARERITSGTYKTGNEKIGSEKWKLGNGNKEMEALCVIVCAVVCPRAYLASTARAAGPSPQ